MESLRSRQSITQKFLNISWIRRFITINYNVHNSLPLTPILSPDESNPYHPILLVKYYAD
jgi:hypothetical protein